MSAMIEMADAMAFRSTGVHPQKRHTYYTNWIVFVNLFFASGRKNFEVFPRTPKVSTKPYNYIYLEPLSSAKLLFFILFIA
jgi:hypothetical protein